MRLLLPDLVAVKVGTTVGLVNGFGIKTILAPLALVPAKFCD